MKLWITSIVVQVAAGTVNLIIAALSPWKWISLVNVFIAILCYVMAYATLKRGHEI